MKKVRRNALPGVFHIMLYLQDVWTFNWYFGVWVCFALTVIRNPNSLPCAAEFGVLRRGEEIYRSCRYNKIGTVNDLGSADRLQQHLYEGEA